MLFSVVVIVVYLLVLFNVVYSTRVFSRDKLFILRFLRGGEGSLQLVSITLQLCLKIIHHV